MTGGSAGSLTPVRYVLVLIDRQSEQLLPVTEEWTLTFERGAWHQLPPRTLGIDGDPRPNGLKPVHGLPELYALPLDGQSRDLLNPFGEVPDELPLPVREGHRSLAGYDVDGTGVGPAVVGSAALEAEIGWRPWRLSDNHLLDNLFALCIDLTDHLAVADQTDVVEAQSICRPDPELQFGAFLGTDC